MRSSASGCDGEQSMDAKYIETLIAALATNVLIALGSGSIASLAIIFLARNWISERLKQSIEHEYAEKLATFKAELKAQQEVAIERIRSMHSLAATSFVESRKAAQERELKAIEDIWQAILQIPAYMPPWVSRMDIMTSEEWKEAAQADGRNMGLASVDESLGKLYSTMGSAESARLFADEYAYALLYAFRAVSGRIIYLHERAQRKGEIKIWHEDAATRQLLSLIFDKNELAAFDREVLGHYATLGNEVKRKFKNIANSVSSGTKAAQDAIKQAQAIIEASAKLAEMKESA
jgi:hypothetical protein